VRVVSNDIKSRAVSTVPFTTKIYNFANYYPFGMQQTGTAGSYDLSSDYRYGYNGKEKDDEIKGEANSLDYGARIYDPRVGRWMSTDPLESKYPSMSAYNYVANTPIMAIDPDGRDVHIVIGDKPVGTARIRLIGSEEVNNSPSTIEVPLYKMTITDDVTGKISEYFVTRDAPVINQVDPVDEQIMPSWLGGDESYNITNTSFEPRGDNKYNLIPTTAGGEGAYALRTTTGNPELPAEPNNSPFRKKADVADGVMIHIGGTYKAPDGSTRITGSEGCFTLQGKDAGNKGIQRLVKDINQRKVANKKAGKGTNIDLEVKKRKNVKKEYTVDKDGTEGI
jgi:RHS repeat-associated protein